MYFTPVFPAFSRVSSSISLKTLLVTTSDFTTLSIFLVPVLIVDSPISSTVLFSMAFVPAFNSSSFEAPLFIKASAADFPIFVPADGMKLAPIIPASRTFEGVTYFAIVSTIPASAVAA